MKVIVEGNPKEIAVLLGIRRLDDLDCVARYVADKTGESLVSAFDNIELDKGFNSNLDALGNRSLDGNGEHIG